MAAIWNGADDPDPAHRGVAVYLVQHPDLESPVARDPDRAGQVGIHRKLAGQGIAEAVLVAVGVDGEQLPQVGRPDQFLDLGVEGRVAQHEPHRHRRPRQAQAAVIQLAGAPNHGLDPVPVPFHLEEPVRIAERIGRERRSHRRHELRDRRLPVGQMRQRHVAD